MSNIIHLAIDLRGLLNNYQGREIDIFIDDDGRPLSDVQARIYIEQCLAKGWSLIPSCDDKECPEFDHFFNGCPGHTTKKDTNFLDTPVSEFKKLNK